MSTDRELIEAAQRDLVREVFREVLAERDRKAAEEREAREAADAEYLANVRRKDLTPRQVSELVDRIGMQAYLALPYGDPKPAARRRWALQVEVRHVRRESSASRRSAAPVGWSGIAASSSSATIGSRSAS
jgi:hypothetical protein